MSGFAVGRGTRIFFGVNTVAVALDAMATRFEIVLHGENPLALRAAGEEALAEVTRLEAQLSLYRATSEIAHLNARAAHGPVRVTPGLFALLEHAKGLHEASGGAFDITVAPLVRCWGFMGGTGRMPTAEEIAEARAKVGMHLVQLNPRDCTVEYARNGVMLDLGAIGKGYAVERAAEILREAGVSSAMVHGGTSTIYALGHPPDAESWKVAVANPRIESARVRQKTGGTLLLSATGANRFVMDGVTISLSDEALSVSAVWGRCFEAGERMYGHVIDPRTGQPVAGTLLAAIVLPSATETDALSTALLALGSAGQEKIAAFRPGMRALLIFEANGDKRLRVEAKGIEAPSAM